MTVESRPTQTHTHTNTNTKLCITVSAFCQFIVSMINAVTHVRGCPGTTSSVTKHVIENQKIVHICRFVALFMALWRLTIVWDGIILSCSLPLHLHLSLYLSLSIYVQGPSIRYTTWIVNMIQINNTPRKPATKQPHKQPQQPTKKPNEFNNTTKLKYLIVIYTALYMYKHLNIFKQTKPNAIYNMIY